MRHIKLFELFVDSPNDEQENIEMHSDYQYTKDDVELYPQQSNSKEIIYVRDLEGNELGSFTVSKTGDIYIDPANTFTDEEIIDNNYSINTMYSNSALFEGGFMMYVKNKGVGKAVIHKYFEMYPEIENIFLYAVPWQGSIPFWHKIGGKSILNVENKTKSVQFIQLSRENVLNA